MHKKSNSFVYTFVINCQIFPKSSGRVCPVQLKIDVVYHMNNTFRNTVFLISVEVPLTNGVHFSTILQAEGLQLYQNYAPYKYFPRFLRRFIVI